MTQHLNSDQNACAAWIARFLKAHGIDRMFGLQGGQIQPIWDHIHRQGIAPALQRALKNAPALVDVVTSQTVQSSDAQKGLGFVPDYQALFAWDEAEQKRRGSD